MMPRHDCSHISSPRCSQRAFTILWKPHLTTRRGNFAPHLRLKQIELIAYDPNTPENLANLASFSRTLWGQRAR